MIKSNKNVPQTPGKTKARRGRGKKKVEEDDPADQTVSQPATSTRATRARARADSSVLEDTMAESLNTTRATRKNTRRTTRKATAETSVLEETVAEPAKTSRSTRRTTKTAVQMEEEGAVESQPIKKSTKR